jgi:hypothetical protein
MPGFIRALPILLLALIGPPIAFASEIRLIDARTGFGLEGVVTMVDLDGPVAPVVGVIEGLLEGSDSTRLLSVSGRSALALSGPVALRAEAPGYRVLHTVLRPAREHRGWTLVLDPLEPAPLPVAEDEDRLIISGWVSDVAGRAVSNAAIEVGAVSGRSGLDGHFQIEIDAPRVTDGMPEALAIRVTAAGQPEWLREDVIAAAGGLALPIRLGGPEPIPGQHR